MEIIVKHFNELTASELHEIYKLRIEIFIVEQNCPYQDVDDYDKDAYHVYAKDESGIIACARVLPVGRYDTVSIGRVVCKKRRQGIATALLKSCLEVAKEKLLAREVIVGAQIYCKSLYEKVGFVGLGDEYLEDGIPHTHLKNTLF